MNEILTRLNPDESMYNIYEVLNGNMTILDNFINTFELMFDSSTGEIDLTLFLNSKIKVKELIIPTGNLGITVGNTKIKDNEISTKQIKYSGVVKNTDSTQYISLVNNMINGDGGYITPSSTISTLVLNPTQNLLQVEMSAAVDGIRQEITVVNLSTNNSTVTLLNNNFMLHNHFTEISIPYSGNVTFEYINDSNVNAMGWIIKNDFNVTYI